MPRLQSPSGGSSLITSAPCCASSVPQYGPASPWLASRTRSPANGRGAAPDAPDSMFFIDVRLSLWKNCFHHCESISGRLQAGGTPRMRNLEDDDDLSPEQRLLRESVAQFMDREVRPT